MDRPVAGTALPDWARPLATQIEREMETLAYGSTSTNGSISVDEKHLFAQFEHVLALAQNKYEALVFRRPESLRDGGRLRLVFQPLYDDALPPPAGTVVATSEKTPEFDWDEDEDYAPRGPSQVELLSALMAALVESLGPLRLSRQQSTWLADVLFRLGRRLGEAGLPIHSIAAYENASRLYRDIDDDHSRDRVLRQLAAARHHAMPPGLRRRTQDLNAMLFGYGYEPYRFLGWIGVQLAVACALVAVMPYDRSALPGGRLAMIYLALQDFVVPMGLGDTNGISHWVWGVLVVESYTGLLSTSVFFALLLRRWFRS